MNKQNSKKIAICFFGLSKCKDAECRRGRCMEIDHFKYNYENYQEKIFDYFLGKGYKIDVYFSTNDTMNDIENNKLINAYKPINCNFIDENLYPVVPNYSGPTPTKMASKHRKVENVLEMCLDSKIDYDLVLLTRFDLIFNDNFNESNIKLDKFNMVSELEHRDVICDNFYLFPFKYLREFLEIAKDFRTTLKGYHMMRGAIEKRLNTKINMIKNERKIITDLTFYEISYRQRPHPRLR